MSKSDTTVDHAMVKCLVWDLDNTLWRGILLEGDEVRVPDDIRNVVIELDSRGILQAVSSKNDYDRAWAKLTELQIADYFLLARIGWGRKSDSVREIAEQLGFAHQTMAFIDDQPTARAEVTFHLPDVRCYPAELAGLLPEFPEFSPVRTNTDSRRRRDMYRTNLRREAERTEFLGADQALLASLNMELEIKQATEDELGRAEELTLRTSQMNATGVHYSDITLRELLADPDHEVLVTTLADRFGTHGAIGIILLRKHSSVWHLKLLATSCRVTSFGVGAVLLNWLIGEADRSGVHLVADFRRTERNRIMEVAYRFAGLAQEPCECRGAISPADDVQHLHLRPRPQSPPTTMRVVAPVLAHAAVEG